MDDERESRWSRELQHLGDSLRRLMPSGVVVETSSGTSHEALLPEEAAATRGWTMARRHQFAAGRACARRALARLGHPASPLLFDGEGVPIWPSGAVGSISHKQQSCIVVVALSGAVSALGVDLEIDRDEPDEGEIQRRVCLTATEQRQAAALRTTAKSPSTLFLSAKEAFFKCQFPLTHKYLDWGDVEVLFDSATFEATVISGGTVPKGQGAIALAGDWIGSMYRWNPS